MGSKRGEGESGPGEKNGDNNEFRRRVWLKWVKEEEELKREGEEDGRRRRLVKEKNEQATREK